MRIIEPIDGMRRLVVNREGEVGICDDCLAEAKEIIEHHLACSFCHAPILDGNWVMYTNPLNDVHVGGSCCAQKIRKTLERARAASMTIKIIPFRTRP